MTIVAFSTLTISYLSISVYLSLKAEKLIETSYSSFGEDNEYRTIISDELFVRLNYRRNGKEYNEASQEINHRTFPITFFLGNKANIHYWYTYERRSETGRVLCGSSKIPMRITLNLKDWLWTVVDVDEKA
ncbi:MAG: hypothetical protein WCN92_00040 [Eubacteriales bacterium]